MQAVPRDNHFTHRCDDRSSELAKLGRRWPLTAAAMILSLSVTAPIAMAKVVRPVADVQKALAEKGFDPGTADGLWGKKSISALRAFQKSMGLPETDTIDEPSLAVLFPAPVIAAAKVAEMVSVNAVPISNEVAKEPAPSAQTTIGSGPKAVVIGIGFLVFSARRGRRASP
jgi:peptidoglycan hydrolase-like protein with peptidoglycan-binding domain